MRLITKNAVQAVVPLLALLIASRGDITNMLILAGIGLAIVVAVASLLSYWFFRFQIGDDSILIRQGVIKKKQIDIKFDRIQGINTQQNPLYRLLGLVTVTFDTAGSAGSEGNLPAVTRSFADALRQRIGKSLLVEESDSADSEAGAGVLVSLDWRDMIRIGLADRRALLVLAFIGPLLDKVDEKIETFMTDFVTLAAANGLQIDGTNSAMIGAGLIVVVILIFAAASIAAAFLRYHNFELVLQGDTLRSSGGLLTRHEHSMKLGKIQTLRLQQGVLQRLLKRHRMTARQAVSGGRNRSQNVFVVPVVTSEQADRLRKQFLAPEAGRLTQDPTSDKFVPISLHYMRSRILFGGLLPALVATIALGPLLGVASLLFMLWLPAVAGIAYRNWKRAGFMHDDDEIVRRSGLLGFRTVGLLFRKVQRVTVTQSRYQRRKGLASLRLYMASGSVRLPYIDHDNAKQLRDYILFRVESSDQAWH